MHSMTAWILSKFSCFTSLLVIAAFSLPCTCTHSAHVQMPPPSPNSTPPRWDMIHMCGPVLPPPFIQYDCMHLCHSNAIMMTTTENRATCKRRYAFSCFVLLTTITGSYTCLPALTQCHCLAGMYYFSLFHLLTIITGPCHPHLHL